MMHFVKGLKENNPEIMPIFSLMPTKSSALCAFESKPVKTQESQVPSKQHIRYHGKISSKGTFAGSLFTCQAGATCFEYVISLNYSISRETSEDTASAQGQNLNSKSIGLPPPATFITYFSFYVLHLTIAFPSRRSRGSLLPTVFPSVSQH